jgi:integrase
MQATGHVRLVERKRGAVFYAALRLADGRRAQRKLGKAWLSRSRPPVGYITRAQAEAKLAAILEGADPTVQIAGPGVTFGIAAEEWLAYVRDDRKRRPSTVAGYRSELDHNLLPAFGADTPLAEITTRDIDAYREKLIAERRLSPRSINKHLAQLHAIFKRAQRVHGLPVNPVEAAERQPERPSGDIRVLAPTEVEQVAGNLESAQDAAVIRLAAYTGLRLGELRALRWADVDWARRILHVRRSYTRGREGPPKSGKVRSVPLSDQPARILEALSRRELFTDDDDLVFVSPTGSYIDDSNLRSRFHRALRDLGLPHARLHDLRHTFGTLAVQAFPLTDVQAFMGHADIHTTMIYVHHVPQHDAADKFTALLEAARGGSVRRTLDARFDAEPEAEDGKPLENADSEWAGLDSNQGPTDYEAGPSH